MITVRPAKQHDAPAMGSIYVDAWRDAYPGLLPDDGLLSMSAERQAFRWAHIIMQQSGKEACLVAEHSIHGVVGLGSAGPTRTRDLPFGAEVFSLYVDPNHQGQGAGQAMLESLFRAMRQAGQRSAVIWALEGNPARAFYEGLGGQEVASRRSVTFGAEHGEIAFGWPNLSLVDRARATGG